MNSRGLQEADFEQIGEFIDYHFGYPEGTWEASQILQQGVGGKQGH